MNGERPSSVSRLVTVYIVFCVIVLLSMAISLNHLVRTSTSIQANNILSLMSEKVNTSFNMMVNYVGEAAEIVAADEKCDPLKSYEQLQKTVEAMPYSGIGIIDGSGRVYGKAGEKLDIEKQGFAAHLEEADDIYISEPYRSSVTGSNMITMFAPIHQNGKKAGYLYANYALETVQELAYTNVLSDRTSVFLMNPFSGNYVSCSEDEGTPAGTWSNLRLIKAGIQGINGYDYNRWLENMRINSADNLVNYNYNNTAYTEVYMDIHGMKNWYLVIRIPLEELSYAMHQYTLGVGICTALLILATVLLAAHLYEQEHRQNETLQDLSDHDPLTGLYNRRAFDERLEDVFGSGPPEDTCTFMFFDIDYFKSVNDNHGHAAGDTVLCAVAGAIDHAFADTGLAARIGGDEFNVFIYEPLTVADIDDILANLRQKLKNFKLENGEALPISFSAGLAVCPQDAHDLKSLKDCADKALYVVKDAGRNDHRWYHDIKQ